MILSDGKETVKIEMRQWTGTKWGPDMSHDIIQVPPDGYGVSHVKSVDYIICQLSDWMDHKGDFDDGGNELRSFDVDYLTEDDL